MTREPEGPDPGEGTPAAEEEAGVRLHVFLARAGVGSRRACEELIRQGRVTVNGTRVERLGTRVVPERDHVRVAGRRVGATERPAYYAVWKPRGIVATASDPEGRPTVIGMAQGIRERVFPVGRLDIMTEGLLLLTNDGALAEALLAPRTGVPRRYEAKVRGELKPENLRELAAGVRLKGRRTGPIRVRMVTSTGNASWIEVEVREGRQHLVRDALALVGHPVVKLRRVAFGPIGLEGLEPGTIRRLLPAEVAALRRAAAGTMVPGSPRIEQGSEHGRRGGSPRRRSTVGKGLRRPPGKGGATRQSYRKRSR